MRERRRRLDVILEASKLMPFMAVELPGGVFVTSSADAAGLLAKGSRAEFTVLRRAVELIAASGARVDGSTLVDVGANVGTTSVTALSSYGFGRAVAVEPDPVNVRLLRANAALNDVNERVTVVSAAAADLPERRRFARGRTLAGDWSTGTGRMAKAGDAEETEEVEVVTLDGLVEDGVVDPSAVGLVWLDVQGNEADVLAGASRLLSAAIPLVVAMRPLELSRPDALGSLQALLAPHHPCYIDLRRPTLRDRWRPVERPVSTLVEFEGDPISTDLLVLPASRTLGQGDSAAPPAAS